MYKAPKPPSVTLVPLLRWVFTLVHEWQETAIKVYPFPPNTVVYLFIVPYIWHNCKILTGITVQQEIQNFTVDLMNFVKFEHNRSCVSR